jgi:hypothetical protein
MIKSEHRSTNLKTNDRVIDEVNTIVRARMVVVVLCFFCLSIFLGI